MIRVNPEGPSEAGNSEILRVIRRCRSDVNDREAWDALYRAYYPYVLFYARAFRLPWAGIGDEDVANEIFLKMIERFPEVEFSSERHFRNYLRVTCENHMVDLVRKYERQVYQDLTQGADLAAHSRSPEELASETERREAVLHLVDALPERCRRLLGQFLGRGLSLAEIARRESIPAGTIYPRFSRCVSELRARVAGAGLKHL
jgi:RNA polymerase sigma-70 factor (ECF subfamily)